jgi:CRISPR-associated protein (TIGR02584 family)
MITTRAPDVDSSHQQRYARRILLCVTGLSPQIVTETVYALARTVEPAWVPTEVHVATTARGADMVRLNLLSSEPGHFARLCADYGLAGIAFGDEHIHVLRDASGQALDDIRTPRHNEIAADLLTDLIRSLSADDDAALHVSLAGGRKTMGFFAGYALSLFARPQDRLSHVLVQEPYESHPEFYYPTPRQKVIQLRDGRGTLDAAAASVWLADIPLVRLRGGLPRRLLDGSSTFSAAVAAAQRQFAEPELVIDLAARRVRAGGVEFDLPPQPLAFLSWFARRAADGQPPLERPRGADADYAEQFLAEYRRIVGEMGSDERIVERFRCNAPGAGNPGMSATDFDEFRSKLAKHLRTRIDAGAETYVPSARGHRPHMRYALDIPARAIRFGSLGTAPAAPAAPASGRRASRAASTR